jgi:hypothetical protein
MTIKLTIAALAVMIPLALAAPTLAASADTLSANDRAMINFYCWGKEEGCVQKSLAGIGQWCVGHDLNANQFGMCAGLVMLRRDDTDIGMLELSAYFAKAGVADTPADRAADAAKKRANGDLPQTDWRPAKPANDWKIVR